MTENTKAIGTMNGRWAWLFKLFLVTYNVGLALAITLAVYLTRSTLLNNEFREKGDRFTNLQAAQLEQRFDAKFAE